MRLIMFFTIVLGTILPNACKAAFADEIELACGKEPPPPPVSQSEVTRLRSDIDAQAQALSKLAAEGHISAKIDQQKQTIYQDTNKTAATYRMMILLRRTCVFIYMDNTLTGKQKAQAYIDINRAKEGIEDQGLIDNKNKENEPTVLTGEWTGSYYCSDQFGTGSVIWNISFINGALQIDEKFMRMGVPGKVHYDATLSNKGRTIHLITIERGGYEILANLSNNNKQLNGRYINHGTCQRISLNKL